MNINNFRIILITPFKTGSTTLSKSLQNDGFMVVAERNKNIEYLYKRYNYFIVKGHTAIPRTFLNQNKFDVWFTIIRKPTEIYPSAYFQEITNSGHSTYYGDKDKVLGANVNHMIEHFMKYDWDKMSHTSYDFNFDEIYKYTNIDITKLTFDKKRGFSIYKSPIRTTKVVVLTIESISKYKKMLQMLGLDIKNNTIQNSNISKNKWYSNKYEEFKTNLPSSYYEKFKKKNDEIINHFYT
jgi:hypothetical protein